MKAFFEEYGFVALSAVVVIFLITLVSPVGTVIKTALEGFVDSFSNLISSSIPSTAL